MAITAEFVLSAASSRQFPSDGLPEVALVGRSNVGKSSMINTLTRMSKLARTSNTPGRTQTLNFYRIWPQGKPRLEVQPQQDGTADRFSLRGSALEAAKRSGAFYIVDMPGYGYARVSESQRRSWQKLIERYLLERETLRAVIQVVDMRHPPTADDRLMWDWLCHYDKARLCLATKADKIGRNQRQAHLRRITTDLDLQKESLLAFSADDGLGRDELWRWMLQVVGEADA